MNAKANAAAALYQKAEQALHMGQFAAADQLCRQILADFPGNGSVLHLQGLIAFRAGRLAEARALIEQSFVQNPHDPDAHNSLGAVLLELGEPEKALGAFNAALKLRHANPDAHANRARALLALHRPEEAVAGARQALALRPDHFEAWTHLGNGLLILGRLPEAAEAFAKAVALRPDNPGAHINFGRVAIGRERFGQAEAAFRHALAAAPDNTEARLGLGNLLKRLGRSAEAKAVFEDLLRLSPGDADGQIGLADALLQLGNPSAALALCAAALERHPTIAKVHRDAASVYASAGRRQAAIETLKRALAIDPLNAETLSLLLEIQDPAADDPLVAQAENLLTRTQSLTFSERFHLQFILGKILLKGQDADRAFAYLNAANRAKRTLFDFQIENTELLFQTIADQNWPGIFRRFQGAGAASDLPIFIVGMPRSGTTLTEQILASHPDVWGAGELEIMNDLFAALPAPGYPSILAQGDPAVVTTLGADYLARVSPMAGGRKHLVDKLPNNFINAGLIALALPGARIIHCQRDAVDTCLSCYSLDFTGYQPFAYDQTELGRYWRAYDRLMAHWRAVLPADRFLEVQYEDVVADLEGQARRLIDFVGLSWDDACLSFHKTERVVRTASHNQARQPIYASSVRRWARFAPQLRPLLQVLQIEPPT